VRACCASHLELHRAGDGPCFPWTVREEEHVGRYMVTTRKVRAGETLFEETPVVIGPNQEGSPICLSCYSRVGLEYLCSRCGYPVCDIDCEQSPVHAAECRVLSRGDKPVFSENEDTEAYHCILPLRLLLLSRSDPDRYSLTDRLMDHEEDRSQGEDWMTTERTVVQNLLENCQAGQIEKFTVDEVRRAVGVLEVNSYEVHSFVSCGYRGCFPTASLLSHGCRANSRHIWSTTPPYKNTCIASVDIEEGEEVITSYHIPTTCALLRRPKLLEGWYFLCSCKRCLSVDELGTNMNTLVCPACKKASLLPSSTNCLGVDWVCTSCGHRESEAAVLKLVKGLLKQIKSLAERDRYNIPAWLKLLDTAEAVVHHNHEAVVEICKWLLPVLCRGPTSSTADFPRDLVTRKLQLSTNFRQVLDVVDPGFSKSRAKALYEETETDIYLTVTNPNHDFTKPNHDFTKPNHDFTKPNGETTNNGATTTCNRTIFRAKLEGWMSRCKEILAIMSRLGCNKGFEEIIFKATQNILRRCLMVQMEMDTVVRLESALGQLDVGDRRNINGDIRDNNEDNLQNNNKGETGPRDADTVDISSFTDGWTLLELWKWTQ